MPFEIKTDHFSSPFLFLSVYSYLTSRVDTDSIALKINMFWSKSLDAHGSSVGWDLVVIKYFL